MRFFEKCRPSFYFHGGRLIKDNKTGKHFWRLNLVITCVNDQMVRCDEIISNNYLSIETRANQVEELKIGVSILGQVLKFFALDKANAEPVLEAGPIDLSALQLTRVDSLTELWFTVEIEQTPALHKFVGDFIFTRLWVEFWPEQLEIGGESPKSEPVNMTLQMPGGEEVHFTGEDLDRVVENLDRAAKRARTKGKRKADAN